LARVFSCSSAAFPPFEPPSDALEEDDEDEVDDVDVDD
jgi:hypothetical protein